MRENFNRSLDVTLEFEGGYVNHPKDPGGHTNKGITLATLRRYKPGASVADLKAIPIDLVRRIYRDGYWSEVKGDSLAAGVDLATFDYGVNSGPGAARKSLAAVLGGPAHETVKRLCARRLSIYRGFKHWKSFGKGWTRRITAIEAKGVAWALAALPQVEAPVVKEKLEDEAKAAGRKASQQTAGGTGAGGATVAPVGQDNLDHVAFWLLAGGVVCLLALAGFLFWRAYVNRQRKAAYAAEAGAL